MPAGAASQFFCEVPSQSGTSGQLGMAGDTYDECVYREDTLVLLELTTRDMMEASKSHAVHTLLLYARPHHTHVAEELLQTRRQMS